MSELTLTHPLKLPAVTPPTFTPVLSPTLQRQACATCEDERKKKVAPYSAYILSSSGASARASIVPGIVPGIVHEALNSSGQPLDASARKLMEPRFGHDFSRVLVHTDGRAAESPGR